LGEVHLAIECLQLAIMLSSLLLAAFLGISIPTTVAQITNDSYFYGESPPVYPSRKFPSFLHIPCLKCSSHLTFPSSTAPLPGSLTWSTALSKAQTLVSQMTLLERANITVGYTPTSGCSGQTGSVPRLNWTGICLSDAGNGLRNTDFVNGWPSGLHVGASWNRELALQRGTQMGGEFKKKGVNVALGPVVGPLGRVPEAGRNWEGMSNDREFHSLAWMDLFATEN